jgi:hypothetical protein
VTDSPAKSRDSLDLTAAQAEALASRSEPVAAIVRRAASSEHALNAVLHEVASGTPALALDLVAWLLRERRHLAAEETVKTLRAQVEVQRELIHRLEELSDDAQEAVASCEVYEERVAELETEHEELRERIARVVAEDGAEEGLSLQDGVERLIEELEALRGPAGRGTSTRFQ